MISTHKTIKAMIVVSVLAVGAGFHSLALAEDSGIGQFGAAGQGWAAAEAPDPQRGDPLEPRAGDAADIPGGHASTHIVIQVRPKTAPQTGPDGLLSIVPVNPADRTPEAMAEAQLLAAAFQRWAVIDIHRGVEAKNQELAAGLGLDRFYKVRVPRGTDTRSMASQIGAFNALIERAEVDGIASTTEANATLDRFSEQWALKNTGQTGGRAWADISASLAWEIHDDANDQSIVLAILDTGVSDHEDLAGRLIPGWNAVDDNDDTDDVNGHGTHVAGIAAGNAGSGISGVSRGARILPVKVLANSGFGSWFNIANGLTYAADNGADVVNMSLGGGADSYMQTAVQYAYGKGVLMVASSGNSGTNNMSYPALYPEVMSVGATDHDDLVAAFSSTGPELSVSAPGVDILSLDVPGGYRLMSGTSMAAPHVAGLACLLLSLDPNSTHEQIRKTIEETADNLGGPGRSNAYGAGRINAAAALASVTAIHVSGVAGDKTTIQAAIDKASDEGMTMIVVAPGVYYESIDFGLKTIQLRSSHGPAATTIKGGGTDSVVTISGGQGRQSVLHGFTVTGGSGTNIAEDPEAATYGGAMYIAGSSPTVISCIFMDNSAGNGDGIYSDVGSNPGIGASFFSNSGDVRIGESEHIAGPWIPLGGIEFATSVPTLATRGAHTVELGVDKSSGGEIVTVESVRAQGRHRTATTVDATGTADGSISRISVTVGTGVRSNSAPVTTAVELWNFDRGNWSAIGSFPQPTQNSITTFSTTGDPTVFVGGSGEIRTRIQTEAQQSNSAPPYLFEISHVSVAMYRNLLPGQIQQQINDAPAGEVITIAPGVYNEFIDFKGKAITLRSANPEDDGIIATTILDATGFNTTVVTMVSGEGAGTILDGFTITGGAGTVEPDINGDPRLGGGMYIRGSSPTIRNCVFVSNRADSGGGIFNYEASPIIVNCDFVDNLTTWIGGAAIYNLWGSNASITGSTFTGNHAKTGVGGGIRNQESNPTLEDCLFDANIADAGGAMFNGQGSLPHVINCIFDRNQAVRFAGGAVNNFDHSHITVDGRSFTGNTSVASSGAIFSSPDSSASIGSSDFCFNEPNDLGGPWTNDGGNTFCDGIPVQIQDLIIAASNGDTIILEPGTYYEPINFNGKAITLQSRNPEDPEVVASTIIDVTGFNTSAVMAVSGEGPDTVLNGFTITGGRSGTGGGMRNVGSSPTIMNCVFVGNAATYGGGMSNDASSPAIINCTFLENTASFYAGGMDNVNGSKPTITGSFFIDNHAGSAGGGMFNYEGSNAIVESTEFTGNTARWGAGAQNDGSSPIFTDCTFEENMATAEGGGMFNGWSSIVTINGGKFTNNWAGDFGGGMHNFDKSNVVVSGTDLIGNWAGLSGGGIYNEASSPVIELSLFSENVAGGSGGGMYSDDGSVSGLKDSSFFENAPDHLVGAWSDLGGNTFDPELDPGGPGEPDPDTLDVWIAFSGYGGRNSNNHLRVTIGLNPEVSGAIVTIQILQNGQNFRDPHTGTTGGDGSVTFTESHVPSGVYTVEVTTVAAGGFEGFVVKNPEETWTKP